MTWQETITGIEGNEVETQEIFSWMMDELVHRSMHYRDSTDWNHVFPLAELATDKFDIYAPEGHVSSIVVLLAREAIARVSS